MVKDKLIQEDPLRNRKRLGPLGWLIVFIAILFGLACVLGAYSLVTHNVAVLQPKATALAIKNGDQITMNASSLAVTPTLSATPAITWTVGLAKDPMGQTVYDGAPEIKAWAIRDYVTAQTWLDTHLLDKAYLLQHLDEYYTGKALDDGRANLARSFNETFIIMAPPIAQPRQPAPMDKPLFVTFSPDGRQMRLNDYTGAGPAKQYDTRTRKPVAVSLKNRFLWQYLVEFDAQSGRWKIARNTQVINIDTNTLVLSDEP